jgi:DNA-binding XRE family transcriptional regulator
MATAKKIPTESEEPPARGRSRRDGSGAGGSRSGGSRGGSPRMNGDEFARLRASLGKSQRELAELLGLSLKAVESYEQGWRNVPAHVERLMYFLLFKLNEQSLKSEDPCWKSKACPDETRAKCVAFVAKEGRFCWFFTGRLCAAAKSGEADERGCYSCEVFSRMLAKVDRGES